MFCTRRNFLKSAAAGASLVVSGSGALLLARAATAEKQVAGPAGGGLIRPPGALPEKDFRARCIGCGVCVNVCHAMKYDAIAIAGPGSGKNFGTPYIKDMRDFPCTLCMECPKHCPTGALRKTGKEQAAMGMALIDPGLCFGWNGDVCLSCSKVCPLGASVFDFYNSAWGNQPYINDRCVGCGLCVKYCPLGGSAIRVATPSQYAAQKEEYVREIKNLMSMANEERYRIVYDRNIPEIMARGRLVEREYR